MKSVLRRFNLATPLGHLVGRYMAFAGACTRWRHVNREALERYLNTDGPVILGVWHGRLVLAHRGGLFRPGRPGPTAIVSNSREGDGITAAFSVVGVEAVRGSTDKGAKRKGGANALREALRVLKRGDPVAVTPDGPRGPRQRATVGTVMLAKLSGAPILCFGWSCRPRHVLKSWDRMILPFPFGKGVIVWGDPIEVARDASEADIEAARQRLEDELNRVTAEADRLMGVSVIAPEPGSRAEAEAEEEPARVQSEAAPDSGAMA